MKRLLGVGLCVCLLVMAGCGVKEDVELPMVQHVEATAEPAEENAAPQEVQQAFSRGAWNEEVYSNAFAGVTLRLPGEGWTWTDAITLETMTNREEDGTLIDLTDLEAVNENTGESIIVMFENLARSEETNAVTAEEYAGIIAEGLKNNAEFDCTVEITGRRMLSGREYVCLRCEVEDSGMEQLYFMRREGEMMTVVILTGEDAESLVGRFE